MELGAWQASAYAWDSESLQAYQTTSVPQHGEADLSSGQVSRRSEEC